MITENDICRWILEVWMILFILVVVFAFIKNYLYDRKQKK